MTLWRRQFLNTCYQLAQSILDRFCASRKGGTVGGCVHHSGWQCMVAIASACRKTLVNTRWAMCLLSCTKGHRAFHLVGSQYHFRQLLVRGVFSGQRSLTIERSLMSGCVQGHEPTENVSLKLWLKFPVLAPNRSGNTDQGRHPVTSLSLLLLNS